MARTLQTSRKLAFKAATKKAAAATKKAAAATTKVSKHDSNHPTYAEMIKEAITVQKSRKGSSRVAILKYITEHYDINQNAGDSTNHHLNKALKHGIETGELKHATNNANGASGSFKLGNISAETKKKATAKPKAVSKKSESDHASIALKKSMKTTHANKSPAVSKKTENSHSSGAGATAKKTIQKKKSPAVSKNTKNGHAVSAGNTPKKVIAKSKVASKKTQNGHTAAAATPKKSIQAKKSPAISKTTKKPLATMEGRGKKPAIKKGKAAAAKK